MRASSRCRLILQKKQGRDSPSFFDMFEGVDWVMEVTSARRNIRGLRKFIIISRFKLLKKRQSIQHPSHYASKTV